MSVAAVRREIASLEAYGHLHVVDARILVSRDTVGTTLSRPELSLLEAFKARVDAGDVTSSREARDVLNAAIASGPTPFAKVALGVAGTALKWGFGLALVGGALGAAGAMLGNHGGWRDLVMVTGASLGAGVGAGAGLLVGTFRGSKD